MLIEARFPLRGDQIPTDHLYALYAALSHTVPAFHTGGAVRFGPIAGEKGEKGRIRLHQRSALRVRLPAEEIGTVLPLAGRDLDLGGHHIQLGFPTVVPLQAAPALAARVVTYKHAVEPHRFLQVTRQRLDALAIRGEPGIFLIQSRSRVGEPRRVVVRIKGVRIVGYSLLVDGLTAEESIRLQESKFGSRTGIGCGFFVPYRPRAS